TPAEALRALRAGLLDAAIVDNTAALSALGHAPGLRLVKALTLEPYVLAVPAPAFRLHAEVNRVLGELRAEGFFEQNGQKWFVEASWGGPRPRRGWGPASKEARRAYGPPGLPRHTDAHEGLALATQP